MPDGGHPWRPSGDRTLASSGVQRVVRSLQTRGRSPRCRIGDAAAPRASLLRSRAGSILATSAAPAQDAVNRDDSCYALTDSASVRAGLPVGRSG